MLLNLNIMTSRENVIVIELYYMFIFRFRNDNTFSELVSLTVHQLNHYIYIYRLYTSYEAVTYIHVNDIDPLPIVI